MNVSVVVPYRRGPEHRKPLLTEGAHRSVIWDWCRRRWEGLHPGFEIVTGSATGVELNRSAARNAAFAEASGDVLIVADADTVCPPSQIDFALTKIGEGAGWIIAYNDYFQLRAADTRAILETDPCGPLSPPARPRWSTDQGNAGMLVVTREAWEEVKGYDERFEKWGWEDWAFTNALSTLVHGQYRVPGYVLHLCHPRPADPSKQQGKALFTRYDEAMSDPDAMRAILNEEGRCQPR